MLLDFVGFLLHLVRSVGGGLVCLRLDVFQSLVEWLRTTLPPNSVGGKTAFRLFSEKK